MAGKRYLIEEALTADFAFINAYIADEFGNLTYDKTARNMNPLMAMAARRTFAEAERIVPMGEISEEMIVTPGFLLRGCTKRGSEVEMGLGVAEREQIAKRAATEIKQGMIVNLGIGIPSLVPNF